MTRILIALLGAISLSACAAPPSEQADEARSPTETAAADKGAVTGSAPKVAANTPDARAIEAVRQLNAQVAVDSVRAAPLPGFREVIVQGQVVYVSDDGRYLFLPGLQGALYDVREKQNLSEKTLSAMRRELLRTIPLSERIVFAPPNPRHTVAIFTDVECGYCRKFHSQIAEYNRLGIAVQYLAFPRMGIGSEDYRKMVAVWCSPDRRKALTDAKSDRTVPTKDCKNTVTMQYDVGQRAGLTGTPMIIAEDGTTLGGYLPPKELREALDRLADSRKAVAAGG